MLTVSEDFIDLVWRTPGKERLKMSMDDHEPFEYTVKDSGKRLVFDSGMQRDVTTGKVDYTLILSGPMLKRWAAHLTKGAEKYDKNNWMKAEGKEEYDRFRESAMRHFIQWLEGEVDEDHASAVFFNINGAEYVRNKMKGDVR